MTAIIVCVDYLLMAALLFFSMREHPTVLMYFGFLTGSLSKALFLLFCTALIFPLDSGDSASYLNLLAGYVLTVISILQIIKYCKKDDQDTNEEDAMMDGEGNKKG